MPSIPDNQLFRRDDDMPPLSNIHIVGIAVVCVLVGGIATFLLIHWIRKRAAKKRFKNAMGTTTNISLKTRDNSDARSGTSSGSGSFQEKDSRFQPPTKSRPKSSVSSPSPLRNAVAPPTIVIPEPALTAPRGGAASRNEIINFHRQSGTIPKPFSFALARGGPVSPIDPSSAPSSPSDKDSRPSSWIRHSFFSANSGKSGANRYSVMSMRSTTSSFGAEPTTGTTRKVRQIFNPVLPDELLLTKVGEQLTVLQTFDDGWCVVGRENSSTFQQKKSLFKNTVPGLPEDNLELGVVPAWCFLKPVQGLRAERPMRNTSLGITVQIEAPGHSSRNDLVSWCNF